jgi:catechol 2,3-dioxygenase-like lactoylglutathione lyase family enzyme
MKLEAITPMLRTKDLQGSVDFYTGLLGFECGARSGVGPA